MYGNLNRRLVLLFRDATATERTSAQWSAATYLRAKYQLNMTGSGPDVLVSAPSMVSPSGLTSACASTFSVPLLPPKYAAVAKVLNGGGGLGQVIVAMVGHCVSPVP